MKAASKLGFGVHLVVLGSYPLLPGLVRSYGRSAPTTAPLLPPTVGGLFDATIKEMGVFAVVFAVAWLASRASAGQLLLRWCDGIRPIARGMAYSLLLRALLGVAIVLVVSVASKVGRIAISPETLRPHVERLIDPDALRHDPAYLALLLTWVSFFVAGFREELWRAGMFAGFSVLFPRPSESRSGATSIIVCVSVLFGLGHLVQGISAVVLTALLGVGLSMIMRKHRSIWEAVFAHGFFNAASFALLALTTVGAP